METAVGGRKMCSSTPYLKIIIIITFVILIIIKDDAPADLQLLGQAGEAGRVSRQSTPDHYHHHYHYHCHLIIKLPMEYMDSPAATHPGEADV